MTDICYIHQDSNHIIVYPGITAEYHDFECPQLECHHASNPDILEINYCHYGRVGWKLTNDQSI